MHEVATEVALVAMPRHHCIRFHSRSTARFALALA